MSKNNSSLKNFKKYLFLGLSTLFVWAGSFVFAENIESNIPNTHTQNEQFNQIDNSITQEWTVWNQDTTNENIHEHKYEHKNEFNLFKWIVTSLIMVVLIIIIATERIHRTMAVFLFAASLIFISHTIWHFYPNFEFLTLEAAFWSIDWEVIALLTWMMIIVWVLWETWLFQRIAYKLFDLSKWNKIKLLFMFLVTTASLSSILDNVTTMFLITPVAISIARMLKVNPIAYVMPMILASNIWWAATLIWDPPNIMIWAYAWLSFNDFIMNLWLPILFILWIFVFQMYFTYRKEINKWSNVNFEETVRQLKETNQIKHFKLLKASLFVLLLVILFFLLHWMFHMPAAVPALAWAWLLMYFRDRIIIRKWNYEPSHKEVEIWILKAFEKDVEWAVLAFFVFLFMVVWALEHSWMLNQIALLIQTSFWDNLLLSAIVILWVSAIVSAFLDNIPFTAVMLPIVDILANSFTDGWMNGTILWWSLALWACLWWNWTLIWASANIVTMWILEKEWIKFWFMNFFKVWFPSMLIQVFLAMIAIILMIQFNWTL